MANNVILPAQGTGDTTPIVACDELTYSGDTAKIQLVRLVHVTGSEGAHSLSEYIFAEDAAHSSGDYGIQFLGVRNDSQTARSGTDGDYTPIATNSFGEVHIVQHRDLQRIAVTSSGLTTSTTAYVAGDTLGTQFTIAGAARVSGGTGTIVGVSLMDETDIIGAVDVVFTRSSITLAADNAAYAISDGDAAAVVGIVQLPGSYDIGNNRIAQQFNLAIPYDCSGGTSLYCGLITRSGHTFFGATTSLKLVVWVERN